MRTSMVSLLERPVRRVLVASLALLATLDCTPPQAPHPTLVHVELVSAAIALGKADGTGWDGPSKAPPDLLAEFGRALTSAQPVEAYTTLIAHAVQRGIEKPDPVGWAELQRDPARPAERRMLAKRGRPIEDTFTPVWEPAATWSHVELTDRLLLRVHLDDSDVVNDDPIETVYLTSRDLTQALCADGHVFSIIVKDQGAHQLVFVGVSVLRE